MRMYPNSTSVNRAVSRLGADGLVYVDFHPSGFIVLEAEEARRLGADLSALTAGDKQKAELPHSQDQLPLLRRRRSDVEPDRTDFAKEENSTGV